MMTDNSARWRPLKPDDMAAVTAISDEVHGEFTEEQAVLAERQALYPDGCFAFERDGTLVGYIISHPWTASKPPALGAFLGAIPAQADTFYLHDIALLPAARGTGAGAQILQLLDEEAARGGYATITLMAINGADRYWAAQGFSPIPADDKLRQTYGADACLMQRRVNPSR